LVTDEGVVVGHMNGSDNRDHAVRWDRSGAIKDLGLVPGVTLSVACAIGRDGTIVGAATVDGTLRYHPVWWNRFGTMAVLPGLPGGRGGGASAIRGRTIFGSANAANGKPRAASWNWRGEITDLGVLPGGNESVAARTGPDGMLIGYATTANGEFRGVAWIAKKRSAAAW
jgi:uncharacterized membrane protein